MLLVIVSKEYENFFEKINHTAPKNYSFELVDFSLPPEKINPQLSKANAIIGNVDLSNSQYKKAKNLRIIQTLSSGYDQIDLAKARHNKVIVANNNGANAISVAEHVLMLILALYRNLFFHQNSVTTGTWKNLKYTNSELYGKTLGIFGLGNVGKALAYRASAMGVNVQYFDITRQIEIEKKLSIKYVFPRELLKNSDIVSYHVPKTKFTYKIICHNSLKLMRRNSILINTSRGYIQDENAIYEALCKDQIFGAGLDVFEVEPLQKNSPLRKLKNVILTPHSAPDKESYQRSIHNALQNIIRVSEGMDPLSPATNYDEVTRKFLKHFPNDKFFLSQHFKN